MAGDTDAMCLRAAGHRDSPGIIDLVGRCYAEYPGCVLDVDGEEPELRDPAGAFTAFWVLDRDGEVVGTVACNIHRQTETCELKKLYLDPGVRGLGWARRLVDVVEALAATEGVRTVQLWTDTRFQDAHGLYAHLGYRKTGETRELNDKSDTVEFRFVKELPPL